jgi:hypothetical protein
MALYSHSLLLGLSLVALVVCLIVFRLGVGRERRAPWLGIAGACVATATILVSVVTIAHRPPAAPRVSPTAAEERPLPDDLRAAKAPLEEAPPAREVPAAPATPPATEIATAAVVPEAPAPELPSRALPPRSRPPAPAARATIASPPERDAASALPAAASDAVTASMTVHGVRVQVWRVAQPSADGIVYTVRLADASGRALGDAEVVLRGQRGDGSPLQATLTRAAEPGTYRGRMAATANELRLGVAREGTRFEVALGESVRWE